MFITPADLSERDFRFFNEISIENGVLTTRIHLCDADAPLMVFMRQKDLKTLQAEV